MALTPVEKLLVRGLKIFGASEDETVSIGLLLETEEQQFEMMYWMADNPEATPSDLIGKALDITAGKN